MIVDVKKLVEIKIRDLFHIKKEKAPSHCRGLISDNFL